MRFDNVFWQKSKINSVEGFLHDEGDSIIFTKCKGGYKTSGARMVTKQELRAIKRQDKLLGMLQPEKELFRFNRADVQNLQMTYIPANVVAGHQTPPSAMAVFTANGTPYTLVFSASTEEQTKEFGQMLGDQ